MNTSATNQSPPYAVRRLARCALWALTAGMVLAANARDREPARRQNVAMAAAPARPAPFRAGFGRARITPVVSDRWVDADGNARYEPSKGDRYEDVNGNGRFDAVWIAGFHNGRPAQGVHDDLWAIAAVFDDGHTRLAIVALDAIAFMHDDVVDVRKRLPKAWGIDHASICATHCHEVPDLIGLWGETQLRNGVDPAYRERVRSQIVAAIGSAVKALRPARLRLYQLPPVHEGLVIDTRRPHIYDTGVRALHCQDACTGATLGTLVTWANHPEVLWSGNLQITSDYCGYLRDGIERGIRYGSRLFRTGVGGTTLYINGAIGGLLTTRPDTPVYDPFLGRTLTGATFEKARAVGYRVADALLAALAAGRGIPQRSPAIGVWTRTLLVPVDNVLYRIGAAAGVLDRRFVGGARLRTEVNLVTLGDAWIVTIPGEVYPEIVNGGIENPPGADYTIAPVEVPPIRKMMRGKVSFVFGLANDEIGYIIPKSEWDDEKHPPYLYNDTESPYGEVNSLGPETAHRIHRAVQELIAQASHPARRRHALAPSEKVADHLGVARR